MKAILRPQETSTRLAGSPKDREELEREKLAIELEFYHRRQQLELDKLIADVRDWKFKIITGVISALVGVASFYAGQYYNQQTDTQKQEELTFKEAIASLAAKEPLQRVSAVTVLGRYIRPNKPGLFVGNEERNEINERQSIAISTVAGGLLYETDVQVLQAYGRELADAGAAALPDVIRVNRAAVAMFARAAGDYLVQANRASMKTCSGGYDSQPVRDAVASLNNLITRADMPLDNSYIKGQTVIAKFIAGDVLMSREILPILCRESNLEIETSDKSDASASAKSADNSMLIRSAQALSTSSVVLTELMPTAPPASDLSGVSIVAGNLDKLRLQSIVLRRSYIAASPNDFECKGCDFSYADLRYLYGTGDLSGSKFDGVLVNSTFAQQYAGYTKK